MNLKTHCIVCGMSWPLNCSHECSPIRQTLTRVTLCGVDISDHVAEVEVDGRVIRPAASTPEITATDRPPKETE